MGIQFAQYVSPSATELVKWNLSLLDPDDALDLSAGVKRVTPTQAGTYWLCASLGITTPDAGVYHSVIIRQNGVGIRQMGHNTKGTVNETISIGILATANGTTDYFDVQTSSFSAGTTLIVTNANDTFFGGWRIF
jgi:hypothetical protein